jgi:hypothetical protein|tara:strand:+ start:1704 stop:2387 length:684 start_codon:yes stop_codon:yes gene_type:complete
MMKNLLLTLFTALMFSASFSQVSPRITAPTTPGDTIRATNLSFTIDIENTSATTIPAGDTIWYWFRLDGGNFTSFALVSGGVSGALVPAGGLAPGASITRTLGPVNFQADPTATLFQKICAYAAVGINNVSLTSDSSCYTIERSFASVNENTLENGTKVFAVNGVINMTSTSNENLSYSVISITGQTISQGNFINNKQVDLNNVSKGIYMVMITNGTEKVTKKVVIQ